MSLARCRPRAASGDETPNKPEAIVAHAPPERHRRQGAVAEIWRTPDQAKGYLCNLRRLQPDLASPVPSEIGRCHLALDTRNGAPCCPRRPACHRALLHVRRVRSCVDWRRLQGVPTGRILLRAATLGGSGDWLACLCNLAPSFAAHLPPCPDFRAGCRKELRDTVLYLAGGDDDPPTWTPWIGSRPPDWRATSFIAITRRPKCTSSPRLVSCLVYGWSIVCSLGRRPHPHHAPCWPSSILSSLLMDGAVLLGWPVLGRQ